MRVNMFILALGGLISLADNGFMKRNPFDLHRNPVVRTEYASRTIYQKPQVPGGNHAENKVHEYMVVSLVREAELAGVDLANLNIKGSKIIHETSDLTEYCYFFSYDANPDQLMQFLKGLDKLGVVFSFSTFTIAAYREPKKSRRRTTREPSARKSLNGMVVVSVLHPVSHGMADHYGPGFVRYEFSSPLVTLLSSLSEIIPEEASISSFQLKGDEVTCYGEKLSDHEIMPYLNQCPFLSNIRVDISTGRKRAERFSFRARINYSEF